MDSENSKTTHPHRLLLTITDKIDWRRNEKSIALLNLIQYQIFKSILSILKETKQNVQKILIIHQ